MEIEIDNIGILDVNAENVAEAGIYCIKDRTSPGYHAKVEWFCSKLNKGLTIKIAEDSHGRRLGFIEYLPSELAWRPVIAKNYLFIQCIALFVKDARRMGVGSLLIKQCEQDAKDRMKSGVCAMSSDGPWMANTSLFERNAFHVAERLDRFELMVKTFDDAVPAPVFFDWRKEQSGYKGWHLLYSDQCPWHAKSVRDLSQAAHEHGIPLTVKKIVTPKEAQRSPSGFGTFSLIRDGRLLADHYISRTRFENILRKECFRK